MRRNTRTPESVAPRRAVGYTLVEMVTVMAVTAVLAAMTAVFLRYPLQAYQDAQRRAAISDAADTAFGFLKRDLQTALPNSIRVSSSGAVYYVEFLTTRTAGRYRADAPAVPLGTGPNTCFDADGDGLANDNVLQFGVPDACLTTLGALPHLGAVAPNADFLVVYNLGSGFAGADAYASGSATGGNKSLITSVAAGAGGENILRFESNTFALESPGRRFHVVSGPVSYVCDPAAGTLLRIAGYPIAAVQPRPPAGTAVVVAKGISGCTVTYDQNVASQRNGIVSIWLRFADPAGGTTQSLFQQIQVSNDA